MIGIEDVIDFAKRNYTCYVASVDSDKPNVRVMDLLEANDSGFYFQTALSRNLLNQLQQNSKIEVCFHDRETNCGGTVLRINGQVEFVKDKSLIMRLLKIRPMLNYIGCHLDTEEIVIFRIKKGKAHFWNFRNLSEENDFIHFDFVHNKEKDERF